MLNGIRFAAAAGSSSACGVKDRCKAGGSSVNAAMVAKNNTCERPDAGRVYYLYSHETFVIGIHIFREFSTFEKNLAGKSMQKHLVNTTHKHV